jgi:hypothetical protein
VRTRPPDWNTNRVAGGADADAMELELTVGFVPSLEVAELTSDPGADDDPHAARPRAKARHNAACGLRLTGTAMAIRITANVIDAADDEVELVVVTGLTFMTDNHSYLRQESATGWAS